MTKAPHPKRLRAIRELKRNYKWRGVWMCLRRTYPPVRFDPQWNPQARSGWHNLIFHPERIYWQAVGLSEGVFT